MFKNAHKPTLYALGTDYIGGLMGRILHPGACDAQLLHDTVQEPLDIVLGHLVYGARATRRSPAELQAEEEAEKPEPHSGAKLCHLRTEAGLTSANAVTSS